MRWKYRQSLRAHSHSSGGRRRQSTRHGSYDSGQVVLQCDVGHSVGQVEASVRSTEQEQKYIQISTYLVVRLNQQKRHFRYIQQQAPCDCADSQLGRGLRLVHQQLQIN